MVRKQNISPLNRIKTGSRNFRLPLVIVMFCFARPDGYALYKVRRQPPPN